MFIKVCVVFHPFICIRFGKQDGTHVLIFEHMSAYCHIGFVNLGSIGFRSHRSKVNIHLGAFRQPSVFRYLRLCICLFHVFLELNSLSVAFIFEKLETEPFPVSFCKIGVVVKEAGYVVETIIPLYACKKEIFVIFRIAVFCDPSGLGRRYTRFAAALQYVFQPVDVFPGKTVGVRVACMIRVLCYIVCPLFLIFLRFFLLQVSFHVFVYLNGFVL